VLQICAAIEALDGRVARIGIDAHDAIADAKRERKLWCEVLHCSP
jgi:hypothetical protein